MDLVGGSWFGKGPEMKATLNSHIYAHIVIAKWMGEGVVFV